MIGSIRTCWSARRSPGIRPGSTILLTAARSRYGVLFPVLCGPTSRRSAAAVRWSPSIPGSRFEEGTSVGAGQVLEFYVNFGLPGVLAGFAGLGFLLMRLDLGIMRAFAAGDLPGLLLRAMPGLSLLQPGGNLLEILVAACRGRSRRYRAALFRGLRASRAAPPGPLPNRRSPRPERAGKMRQTLQDAGRPLRPVHVIAGLDPAHGGPSYSVPRLCEALAAAGAEPALLSVAAGRDPPCDTRRYRGYPDRRFAQDLARVPGLRALRRSAAFSAALNEAAGRRRLGSQSWLMAAAQLAGGMVGGGGRQTIRRLAARHVEPGRRWHFPAARKKCVLETAARPRHAPCGLYPRYERARNTTSCVRSDCAIRSQSSRTGSICRRRSRKLPPDASGRTARERVVLSLGRMHPKKGLENAVAGLGQDRAGSSRLAAVSDRTRRRTLRWRAAGDVAQPRPQPRLLRSSRFMAPRNGTPTAPPISSYCRA